MAYTIIDKVVFTKLYDLLVTKAAEDLKRPDLINGVIKDREIWNEPFPGEKETWVEKNIGQSPEWFYRIKSKLNKSYIFATEIKNTALILTMKQLEISIDSSQISKRVPENERIRMRAKSALINFMKEYTSEYYLENKTELDEHGYVLSNGYFNPNSQHTGVSLNNDNVGNVEFNVKTLIENFYEAITKREHKKAWDMLTPDFHQRTWGGDFEKFERGYKNTQSILGVHIIEYQTTGVVVKCKVYYEDEVDTFTRGELSILPKLTIAETEKLYNVLEDFKCNLEKTGLKEIENIEIEKLFDEFTLSEYIAFKTDLGNTELQKALPVSKTYQLPRLYNIIAHNVKDKWLLNSIRPIRFLLLR